MNARNTIANDRKRQIQKRRSLHEANVPAKIQVDDG